MYPAYPADMLSVCIQHFSHYFQTTFHQESSTVQKKSCSFPLLQSFPVLSFWRSYISHHSTSSLLKHIYPALNYLLQKFRFVAQYNTRSTSRELEVIMKNHISESEKTHGKIELK